MREFSFLPLLKNKILLDLGCGHGDYASFFSKYCSKVYAIDIDSSSIRNTHLAGNRKKNIFYKVADATNLPFKDSSIDFIWCNQVIEHIKNDRKVFKEVNRVLKKNGLAYFKTPYAKNKKLITHSPWVKKFAEHVRTGYTKEDIKKKTRGLFEIVQIEDESREYSIKLLEFQKRLPQIVSALLNPLFLIVGCKLSKMGKKTTGSSIQFLLRKIN